jgi:hypothetical protein
VRVAMQDPATGPRETIVVRGGVNTIEELSSAVQTSGGVSVISRPGRSLPVLCASVRNNRVRWTTVGDIHDAGGRIEPTDGLGDPPGHCNVHGLTARQLDTILSEPELNPVPRELRSRGTPA